MKYHIIHYKDPKTKEIYLTMVLEHSDLLDGEWNYEGNEKVFVYEYSYDNWIRDNVNMDLN